MPTKRINISLHQLELNKLDMVAEQHQETRSGMISRLIQSCPIKTREDHPISLPKKKKGK